MAADEVQAAGAVVPGSEAANAQVVVQANPSSTCPSSRGPFSPRFKHVLGYDATFPYPMWIAGYRLQQKRHWQSRRGMRPSTEVANNIQGSPWDY